MKKNMRTKEQNNKIFLSIFMVLIMTVTVFLPVSANFDKTEELSVETEKLVSPKSKQGNIKNRDNLVDVNKNEESDVDSYTLNPHSSDEIKKLDNRNNLNVDINTPFLRSQNGWRASKETVFGVTGSIKPTIMSYDLDKNNIEDLKIHLKTDCFDPLKEEPDVPEDLRLIESNGYFIIQCVGPIESEWIYDLQNMGVVILGYVPNYAYIVHMIEPIKNSVEQLSFVRWVGIFHPGYKIDPNLKDKGGVIELNVVVFKEDNGSRNLGVVTNRIKENGGIITYNGTDNFVIRVKIPAEKINDIALLPEVKWIGEYTLPITFMNNVRVSTGASIAHTLGFDGTGIIGEVKGNGFDQYHPDFVGQIKGLEGSPPDGAHGTCTFGTIFSSGVNDINAKGMLPGAEGVFCRRSAVSRTTSMANLDYYWGGVFQSNSWGFLPLNGVYDGYSEENDQCVFDHDKIVMLYAGGNSNTGVYPSSLTGDSVSKNIICVGAVNHSDDTNRDNDEWVDNGPWFTPSQGPAADGRIKPDLCGPFDYGYVTDSLDGDGEDGYCPGNYVSTFGGTSFATPVVAGSAGIVYQMYKENFFGNNPTGDIPHASTVKALLIANAHQYNLDTQANRYQQGWGTPDLEKIIDIGEKHFIIDENYPIRKGQSLIFSFQRQQGYPLKISLVWTDPPSLPTAAYALVNNLNLKVTSPIGNVYWGNYGLENSQWSIIGGTSDNLNNVENVFIENPIDGDWIIEVIAENIAIDGHPETPLVFDQDFALVVTAQASPILDASTMCDWAGPHCDHGDQLFFSLGEECWFYGHITNTKQGDTVQARWKKDGVTKFTSNEWTIAEPWSSVCIWGGYTPLESSLQWQVEIVFNGVPIGNGPVFHVYGASSGSQGAIPFSTFYDELYDTDGSHKRYTYGEHVDVSIYGENIGCSTGLFELKLWIDDVLVASTQDTLSPGEIILLNLPGIIQYIQDDVDCRAEIHYWYSDGGYWVVHDEKHTTIEVEPILYDAFVDFGNSIFYEGPFLPGFLETVASVTIVNMGTTDDTFCVELVEYPDAADENSILFVAAGNTAWSGA